MPRCSAELRHSSKWLIPHLQVIQAVTTFYYLGIVFGADARAETNELCKSKEDIRNGLLSCILFHPPSYTKPPLKCSHCVDNEKKCHSTTDQQGLCEIHHNMTRNVYSNGMCSSKRASTLKNSKL